MLSVVGCFGGGRQVDGSVVTWGDPSSGGKSSKVAEKLKAGVTSAAWQPNLAFEFNSVYLQRVMEKESKI